VSAGAIVNAALYALARIPGVSGRGRIIDPDVSDFGNLNRYMFLLRSQIGGLKAQDLTASLRNGLRFEPIAQRYEPVLLKTIAPLAPAVIVGVDDIPTRWVVQREKPEWLVVGATTHWSAMASFHAKGLGCAQCLHPEDDPGDAPIPTTACTSFWAGLLAASYLVRHAAGQTIPAEEQQIFLTSFRPEAPFRAAVPIRKKCPTCQVTPAGLSGGAAIKV
jgi:molybdopterin/thiamine biosynthesis adenylyltransferase